MNDPHELASNAVLDLDAIRQRSIDDLRDSLWQDVTRAIDAAEEHGKALFGDHQAWKEASRRFVAEKVAVRISFERTFQVLAQALHDAEAQVVWDSPAPESDDD